MSRFPDGFLWGAATSAYQIEGSPLADGAGASIWHRFAHSPGRVLNGDTGDIACDHYRRWSSDVDLMKELGLQAYRFSISWSRILPAGRGAVNAKGIDFYSRLIDRLLEKGIRPSVTLYHWDLPAALDDMGGWLNPDVRDWFRDYARVCFNALGDRVPQWATLNEPWVQTDAGYLHGVNAPGHRNLWEAPIAAHHLLCSHGAAVQAYRAGGHKGTIGLVVNLEPKDPASDSLADLSATARAHTYMNEQFLDPVFLGRYPAGMREVFGEAWPEFPAADMKLIQEPIDFLGINWYTRSVTQHDPTFPPVCASAVKVPHHTYTETGWEVHAPSFTETLCWVKERYGVFPVYITENGAAFYDAPKAIDGAVNDPLRVQYYRDHLAACRDAIEQGVDLRGYYAWSLFDNFEWASGFAKRFGLVHVDFETQARTLKASAHQYREIIRTNGAVLGGEMAARR